MSPRCAEAWRCRSQPAVGTNAYAIVDVGVVSLFFVKGQSEIRIDFSDLDTPVDEKIAKVVALAQSL